MVERMMPLMRLERGIGLAAPQVGWSARVLLAARDRETDACRVFINPEIVSFGGGREWGEEGCLSFPGIWGEVLRYRKVVVRALGADGVEFHEEADDLYARVLQHEIDHLDGQLFITKMRPGDRAAARRRLRELEARHAAAPSRG